MGEMADYVNECGANAEEYYDNNRDECCEECGAPMADCKCHAGYKILSCRHCGMTSVYWQPTDAGWRIFEIETQKIHICPKFN